MANLYQDAVEFFASVGVKKAKQLLAKYERKLVDKERGRTKRKTLNAKRKKPKKLAPMPSRVTTTMEQHRLLSELHRLIALYDELLKDLDRAGARARLTTLQKRAGELRERAQNLESDVERVGMSAAIATALSQVRTRTGEARNVLKYHVGPPKDSRGPKLSRTGGAIKLFRDAGGDKRGRQ